MTEKVKTIRLYGTLGTRFGRVHKYVCTSTADAIRTLCTMIPGFQTFLNESKDKGLGFSCFVGKENIGEESLHAPTGDEDIRIAPMILGSGRGGFFQVLLGAVLVGAAFLSGGVTLAAGKLAFTGVMGQMAFGLGVSMIIGGVTQLLTPQPKGLTGVESPNNGASYNFNGPVNVTAQGNPVPVLYGEAIIGSIAISGDIYSEDQQ